MNLLFVRYSKFCGEWKSQKGRFKKHCFINLFKVGKFTCKKQNKVCQWLNQKITNLIVKRIMKSPKWGKNKQNKS